MNKCQEHTKRFWFISILFSFFHSFYVGAWYISYYYIIENRMSMIFQVHNNHIESIVYFLLWHNMRNSMSILCMHENAEKLYFCLKQIHLLSNSASSYTISPMEYKKKRSLSLFLCMTLSLSRTFPFNLAKWRSYISIILSIKSILFIFSILIISFSLLTYVEYIFQTLIILFSRHYSFFSFLIRRLMLIWTYLLLCFLDSKIFVAFE